MSCYELVDVSLDRLTYFRGELVSIEADSFAQEIIHLLIIIIESVFFY